MSAVSTHWTNLYMSAEAIVYSLQHTVYKPLGIQIQERHIQILVSWNRDLIHFYFKLKIKYSIPFSSASFFWVADKDSAKAHCSISILPCLSINSVYKIDNDTQPKCNHLKYITHMDMVVYFSHLSKQKSLTEI